MTRSLPTNSRRSKGHRSSELTCLLDVDDFRRILPVTVEYLSFIYIYLKNLIVNGYR